MSSNKPELVLAGDMDIDGCTVELKGTKLIFREDSVNNPTLTISNGGTLLMTIDTDTGDLPKVYGEGNLDAVDIEIADGGTLDMQGGTMKNFLLSGAKTGQNNCTKWWKSGIIRWSIPNII